MKRNDLSRALVAFDQDSTIVAAGTFLPLLVLPVVRAVPDFAPAPCATVGRRRSIGATL